MNKNGWVALAEEFERLKQENWELKEEVRRLTAALERAREKCRL